ncbi:MAG: PAS domain S-box protein [Bacteroidales bacterium]
MVKSPIDVSVTSPENESYNLFINLFNSVRDAILVTDTDRNIINCNPAFSDLFGYSLAEISGKPTSLIYRDAEEFREMGQKLRDRMGDPNFLQTVYYSKKSGEIFSGETNVFFLKNQQGEIEGFIGLIRDITARLKTENELFESRESFRATLNSIGDAVITTDLSGKITGINPVAVTLTGWRAEDAIGIDLDRILEIENAITGDKAENPVKKVLASGSSVGLTNHTKLISRYGREYQIADSGSPLRDRNGNVTGVVMVFRDVTKEYEIQQKIVISEKRHRQLVESVKAIVWEYDIVYDRWSYVAPQTENLTGWLSEEWTNLEFWADKLHPDDRDKSLSYSLMCTGRGEPHELEYRFRKKDGSYIWLKDIVSVEMDGNKPSMIRGFMYDISQRKESEIELAENKQFIENVLDNLPIGVAVNHIDDGRAFYMNKRFEDVYGWNRDVITDITLFFEKVYPDPEYREELMSRVMADIATGDPSRMHWENIKITRSDGTESFINALNIPLQELNMVVSTVMDVTVENVLINQLTEAKERAEESDRLKSSFLANISHEIRTPMNGIMGFTELLRTADISNEERSQYIEIIQQSGNRMLETIRDIIDISRIETGHTEVILNDTDINEQLKYNYDIFRSMAEQKGLKLKLTSLLPERASIIYSDRAKIDSILSNLIKNAIKFTESGRVEFGAILSGKNIDLFVKDTGIGIPESMLTSIFERFVQCEDSISRSFEGSGIGLSIVKAYTEMLDGKIRVDSRQGKGTTFRITFPVNGPDSSGTQSAISIDDQTGKVHKRGLKIIIAEDDKFSGQYLAIVLRDIASDIIHAGTGSEVVELCRNNKDVDLILMDITMPEMGGYEATGIIREFNKDVIIIAQTAHALAEDKPKALSAGCDAYISKPVNRNKLLELINSKLFK